LNGINGCKKTANSCQAVILIFRENSKEYQEVTERFKEFNSNDNLFPTLAGIFCAHFLKNAHEVPWWAYQKTKEPGCSVFLWAFFGKWAQKFFS